MRTHGIEEKKRIHGGGNKSVSSRTHVEDKSMFYYRAWSIHFLQTKISKASMLVASQRNTKTWFFYSNSFFIKYSAEDATLNKVQRQKGNSYG